MSGTLTLMHIMSKYNVMISDSALDEHCSCTYGPGAHKEQAIEMKISHTSRTLLRGFV
jgi:hypothetical protein